MEQKTLMGGRTRVFSISEEQAALLLLSGSSGVQEHQTESLRKLISSRLDWRSSKLGPAEPHADVLLLWLWSCQIVLTLSRHRALVSETIPFSEVEEMGEAET